MLCALSSRPRRARSSTLSRQAIIDATSSVVAEAQLFEQVLNSDWKDLEDVVNAYDENVEEPPPKPFIRVPPPTTHPNRPSLYSPYLSALLPLGSRGWVLSGRDLAGC